MYVINVSSNKLNMYLYYLSIFINLLVWQSFIINNLLSNLFLIIIVKLIGIFNKFSSFYPIALIGHIANPSCVVDIIHHFYQLTRYVYERKFHKSIIKCLCHIHPVV